MGCGGGGGGVVQGWCLQDGSRCGDQEGHSQPLGVEITVLGSTTGPSGEYL